MHIFQPVEYEKIFSHTSQVYSSTNVQFPLLIDYFGTAIVHSLRLQYEYRRYVDIFCQKSSMQLYMMYRFTTLIKLIRVGNPKVVTVNLVRINGQNYRQNV